MEVEFSESFTDHPAVAVDYQGMLPVDSQSNIHSPMRPGSTLLPYQPNAAAGSKASGRMGKSQHIAQIRSLGLLHDLQDYISSVECLASEQKKELERVREEKRDMEKCLARAECAAREERTASTALDFSVSEVVDLPPRLRALVEDNRGLRELVKRYKLRTSSLEQQVAQLHSQVLALVDANDRLKQSLAECSRTPAEVDREETLRRQLEVKIRHVENLEHSIGVFRSKLETDSKLYRQNLGAAAREKDALKRQLVGSNRAVEERDKEIRALNVELRRLRRGSPPVRGGPMYHPPVFLTTTAGGGGEDDMAEESVSTVPAAALVVAVAEAATAAPPPGATPAPMVDTAVTTAPSDSEERIRIMLIIVRDEVHVEAPVAAQIWEETASSGRIIQVEDQPQPHHPQPLVVEVEQQDQNPQLPTDPGQMDDSVPEFYGEATLGGEALAGAEVTTAPELLTGEASAIEPVVGTTTDGGYDLSVAGLMDYDTLTGEASLMGGLSGEVATVTLWGGADGASGEAGDETHDAATAAAANGGTLHSHASVPLPIPYSRTAARALATKVGGVSVKHIGGSGGGGTTTTAMAAPAAALGGSKVSIGGGPGPVGGSVMGNTRGGPSLKAVGAASRKQMVQ